MHSTDVSQKINAQKSKIRLGSPKIEIIAPCTLNNGIIELNISNSKRLIELFDLEQKEVLFFIPASGSGSRMFNFLLSSEKDFSENENVLRFLENLKHFAFYDEKIKESFLKWEAGHINAKDLIDLVLGENGNDFLNTPKGLIPFHKIGKETLNAFQEHILQGLKLETKQVKFHFTIQQSFQQRFKESLKNLLEGFQHDYKVEFSFQNPQTDSFAFDQDFEAVKTENGKLVQRPAGHGALLENLIQLDDQYVLIKNIDNVRHLNSSGQTIDMWKVLCGMLIEVKSKLKALFENPNKEELIELNKTIHLFSGQQINSCNGKEEIRELINRPFRICGMVHNEGKSGGGPFFVNDGKGSVTKQIIEAIQVSKDDSQQEKLSNSTHFNPVMMVLDTYDFSGNQYDLRKYRNDENYFVVNKQHNGQDISFIELPGLWNGAMYHWNTIFLEIPIETFTPVKTVLDLLGGNHQANG